MLDITGRVIRLIEIKHKGRINKVVEELEVTSPTNLQARNCRRYENCRKRGVKDDGGNQHDSRIMGS